MSASPPWLAVLVAFVPFGISSACRHAPPVSDTHAPSATVAHTNDEMLDIVLASLPDFEIDPAHVYVDRDAGHAEWRAFLTRVKGDIFALHPKLFEILVRGDYEVFHVRPRPRGPNTLVCGPSCLVVVDRNDTRLILRTWR